MDFSLSKIALLLLLPFVGWLPSGCADEASGQQAAITDLMQVIQTEQVPLDPTIQLDPKNSAAAQDFTMAIFQQTLKQGESSLTSPLSVLYALSMTANGADGDTLSQMEQTLGQETGSLNAYLAAYSQSLAADAAGSLQAANSIWLRNDPNLNIEPAFLQTNALYYQAGIYSAPFDNMTVQAINQWVSDHTNQLIPEIINELEPETMLCLINAVAFDAQWANPYTEYQVRPGSFTTASGETQQVDFMYDSSTVGTYLEDNSCTGFIRYYQGARYGFCALLPKQGVDIWSWAAQLDGEQLRQLLASQQYVEVHCSLPKFTAEYSVNMNEILQAMGMSNAFDPDLADFTRLGSYPNGNLYISAVLHKARIEVYEQGTKAGAATTVIMNSTTAYMPSAYKEVYLDRPFVYMILDRQTDLPVFIGVCAEV